LKARRNRRELNRTLICTEGGTSVVIYGSSTTGFIVVALRRNGIGGRNRIQGGGPKALSYERKEMKQMKNGERKLTGPNGVTGGDSGCMRRRRVGAAMYRNRTAERAVDRGQGSPRVRDRKSAECVGDAPAHWLWKVRRVLMEAPGPCGASALSRLLVVASVDRVRVEPEQGGAVERNQAGWGYSDVRPRKTRACVVHVIRCRRGAEGGLGVGRGSATRSGSVGLGVSVGSVGRVGRCVVEGGCICPVCVVPGARPRGTLTSPGYLK